MIQTQNPFRLDELIREKNAICAGCSDDALAENLLINACQFNAKTTFRDREKHVKNIRHIVEELHLRSKRGIVLSNNPILKQFIDQDPYIFLNYPIKPAAISEAAKKVSLVVFEKECRERPARKLVKKTNAFFPVRQAG